jgi:hypothetical protein
VQISLSLSLFYASLRLITYQEQEHLAPDYHHDLGADASPMASITSLSAADARRLFSEDAVFSVEDPMVGERVKEMQQRGFPIESADGLDFCKQNVFDDTVCRKHTVDPISF